MRGSVIKKLAAALAGLLLPVSAWPQAPGGPLAGGVPAGTATSAVIDLSLDEAINRGLAHNLGILLAKESVEGARGDRKEALADLLPQLRAGAYAVRQKVSLAAFGFAGFPGFPTIIGPFNVFDARGYASQTIFDLHAIGKAQERAAQLKAARYQETDTRDLVVLSVAQLYLEVVSASSRIEAVSARLATAQALYEIANDRKQSGLAAGIEVLRAQVELEAERQRLIVAKDEAAKRKLELARAIGLPLGQAFRITDEMPFAPVGSLEPEDILKRAYLTRADLRAAEERVRAAENARTAALGEGLPSLAVTGDFGAIGNDIGTARTTFTLGAGVRVPLFEGGRAQARLHTAEARLKEERAALEDLRAEIYYEVQAVLLDLSASEERVKVADGAFELGRQQLDQARDRFAAGVAGNIDVVQAQEALARASEDRIESLFALNMAKAALARTLGAAESGYAQILRGRQ